MVNFYYNWKKRALNYLGHLYLSNDNPQIMMGNIMGDFVKGSNLEAYHNHLHEGILLHRKIDHYIDNHPVVLDLNKKLYTHLPRISSIAIDIVFDHLLAKKWEQFHSVSLTDFLDNFYTYSTKHIELLPLPIRELLHRLSTYKMLHQYGNIETIDKITAHLQNKLSFETKLSETKHIFLTYEEEFTLAFQMYMKDAQQKFMK